MAQRRRGLGKGIGALIPDTEQEVRERPIDVFFGASVSRETAGDGLALRRRCRASYSRRVFFAALWPPLAPRPLRST